MVEIRQSSRLISDPWEDLLLNLEAKANIETIEAGNIIKTVDADGKLQWRVKSSYLLASVLDIASERVNATHSRRLGAVMRKLGWSGPANLRFGAQQSKGSFKLATDTDATTGYR